MAYAADMTAAWYAAAPPPPPVSLESQVPPAPINPRLRRNSWRNRSGHAHDGVVRSSSSTASVGFDARVKGDDLPLDSHAPEPERPVSRNAMARIREKERQRARTNSTSAHQTGSPTTSTDMMMHHHHHHHHQPSIVAPHHQADLYSSIRERHDSSPAAAAPYSMYSKPAMGYEQPAPPFSAIHISGGSPADHGYTESGYWISHPEPPVHAAAAYPYSPASVMYSPMTSAPATPMMFPAYSPAPISAQPPYPPFWDPNCPSSPVRQPVPFPTNTAMPPPTVPASHHAQTHSVYPSQHQVSTSRPLPSPSRSSSQGSSVGTGPSSPSLNSLTGTIRRSLPQPPTSTLSRMSSNDSPSTLGRHDSVRMAAEEIMARGPPRRKNISAGSRFGGSPLISKSDDALPSEPKLDASERHTKNSVRVARAESASCLEKEMRELKMKEEQKRERTSTEVKRCSQASTMQAVAPPPQEILRAASPRPIRAAPEPDPAISIDVPVQDVIPARPLSRGPKDERERRRSTIADAAQIPVIFSPPPDAKPPVPTFCFDDPVVSSPSDTPSIVLPGEDAVQPPMIAIEAPAIHLSSDDDDADGNATGPKTSISISVSSSGVAQRSMTTDSGAALPCHGGHAGPQSHSQQQHNHHNHHHHPPNQHNHNYATPRGPAPASASSIGSGASCATCQKWIGGRVVHAMNLTFHPDCFVCCHCSEHLEHVAFYEHEGRPYCHFDFHELFSKRCFHCRTPIVDQRYITINDVDLVGGNAEERCYHDLHFFCANCGDPFMDPKVASSAAGSASTEMIEDADGKVRFGGREFVVHKGYPYCESCHVSLHKPRCKGCKKSIIDAEFLTALKGKWHLNCFCCQVCQNPISTDNFFVKDGQAYDEECYKIKLRSEL